MFDRADEMQLLGLFDPRVDSKALMEQLRQAGVPSRRMALLSSLPLQGAEPTSPVRVPLYLITILAGLVGIGVGIFFAGGTAAMYPLMTGGKPIVAAPIVGIISYETMMLLGIVTTFLVMILRIRRSPGSGMRRNQRIDEGLIGLAIALHPQDPSRETVERLLRDGGASDIVISSSGTESTLHNRAGSMAFVPIWGAVLLLAAFPGCSKDMQEQPSYHSQEAPRLHSPPRSIPRLSRTVPAEMPFDTDQGASQGQRLYHINCLPCHGEQGHGNGPVAAYLKERPADLRSQSVQQRSIQDLYAVITNGKDMMPPFNGELSREERRTIAQHVKRLAPNVK